MINQEMQTYMDFSEGNPGLAAEIKNALKVYLDRELLLQDLKYLIGLGVTGTVAAIALLDVRDNYLQYLDLEARTEPNPFIGLTIHDMAEHFRTRHPVYLDHLNRLLVGQGMPRFEPPNMPGLTFSSLQSTLAILPDKVTDLPIGTVFHIPEKGASAVVIGLATERFEVRDSAFPEIIQHGQTVNPGVLIYGGEGREGAFTPLSQNFYDHYRDSFKLPNDAPLKSRQMLSHALRQIDAGTAQYAYEKAYSIDPRPAYLTYPGKAAIKEAIATELKRIRQFSKDVGLAGSASRAISLLRIRLITEPELALPILRDLSKDPAKLMSLVRSVTSSLAESPAEIDALHIQSLQDNELQRALEGTKAQDLLRQSAQRLCRLSAELNN
jgi:hypothetical protein